VRLRLVDFAHTFAASPPARDDNFLAGLDSLASRLEAVAKRDMLDALPEV
jgi:hypothetical protein